MIAVDTNTLIYAHRDETEFHGSTLGAQSTPNRLLTRFSQIRSSKKHVATPVCLFATDKRINPRRKLYETLYQFTLERLKIPKRTGHGNVAAE